MSDPLTVMFAALAASRLNTARKANAESHRFTLERFGDHEPSPILAGDRSSVLGPWSLASARFIERENAVFMFIGVLVNEGVLSESKAALDQNFQMASTCSLVIRLSLNAGYSSINSMSNNVTCNVIESNGE